MKQSFEVFEQSDGIALHLTVTVDSDAFHPPATRYAITGLKHAWSGTGQSARESCRDSLQKVAVDLTNVIQDETVVALHTDEALKEERGRDSRQGEIDLLDAKIAELQKDLAAEVCAKTALTNELADAKKAAKKPRTPRKAAR